MRNTLRRHWWWAPIGAVIILLTLSIGRTLRAPSPALARPVDAERARRTVQPGSGEDLRAGRLEDSRLVVGNGVVEPRGEVVRVAGAVSGRIAAIGVKEGEQVAAGQVLARLDDGAERADLAAAEAEEAISLAELDRVRRGNRSEERASGRAAAEQALARSSLSRGIYERTSRLHQAGTVPLAELDRARHSAEADEQAARQASAERDRILNGARSEERRAAAARLSGARARLESARVRLAQRRIIAPIAGEVLRVNHRAGEFYRPGEGGPIVELGDTRILRVRMEVDERDLGRVQAGARASIDAPAYPSRRFSASVAELGRRMGRKQIVTGDATERSDVKVLEVLLELEAGAPLVVGQRVTAYISPSR
jgi:multidrug resistance efflux pump